MAIPIFEDFLYPFLSFVGQKDMPTKEMRQAMIDHFHLSDEDCDLMTRSGTTNQLSDRIGWARQYLRRAMLIEIPSRGVYRISERGKQYLATHSDLRKKDLMAYPEFAAYANGTSSASLPMNTRSNIQEETETEITPTEQLESAYMTINKDLASELLQKIQEQSPRFFENLVMDVLAKMGYGTSSVVTRYVRDGGIDGVIFEDKLGLGKINVQAKRYAAGNNIGLEEIQRFAGALGRHTTKGIFITTSDYTRDARDFIKVSDKSLVLINGEDLAKYMIEYNVGVSVKKTYEVKRIDIDYFEE